MLITNKIIFTALFILCFGLIPAQQPIKSTLSFAEIEKKIDSLHNEPQQMWKYIHLYIQKSKREKNYETLVYAYRYASNFSSSPKNIKYSDSALEIGKISGNRKLLTSAYINRGVIYMNETYYEKALDDILIANRYSSELGDAYSTFKTIYLIAQNKIYLGQYLDANKELKSCLEFFKKNINNDEVGKDYRTYYIYSLMSYIDSNTRIGRQKENEALIREGISYLKKNNLPQFIPYFISSEGTDAFYSRNYALAEHKLLEALKQYNDQWPHLTEVYFLGMTYWKMQRRSLAVKYLEEVDRQYTQTGKLDPQFRNAYEILIKYNDSVGNKDKQLDYINKLMVLDKSYEKNFRYLYPKINKEYDTQKLISEKNKIENDLRLQNILLIFVISTSTLITVVFGIWYIRLKKKYKKRFDQIIKDSAEKEQQPHTEFPGGPPASSDESFDFDYYNKISGLNPAFVQKILNQMKHFEESEEYLNPMLTQKHLIEKFETNSTYFSKIINTYKGKNFTNYVNDLRLEYIVNLMKNDSTYLTLDVKELSRICGFGNTESFSDNFQKKYHLKPSYFIKMMQEKFRSE